MKRPTIDGPKSTSRARPVTYFTIAHVIAATEAGRRNRRELAIHQQPRLERRRSVSGEPTQEVERVGALSGKGEPDQRGERGDIWMDDRDDGEGQADEHAMPSTIPIRYSRPVESR